VSAGSTVYDACNRGEIPHTKIGDRLLIPASFVDRAINGPRRRRMHLDGLMEHQAAGVPWLLDNPRGMLAWEMGVGKTATAARAWELTADQGPLLVLCLASARENWRREIQRFAIDPDFPPTVQILFEPPRPIDPAQASSSRIMTSCNNLMHFIHAAAAVGRDHS
jgi:hypothetical protein